MQNNSRLPAEVESRTLCSRPRTALPRTDPLETKDTSAQMLSKKKKSSKNFFLAISKKKGLHQKFFRRSSEKNVLKRIFQALHKILTIQKKCCLGQFSRTWGFEAKAKGFKMCSRGLHLWLRVVALVQYGKLCYANGLNRKRRAGTLTVFTQTIIIPKALTVQIKVLSNRFKSQNKS